MTKPLIMGIDPGFRATGWVICEVTPEGLVYRHCGLIRTKKSQRKVLQAVDDWQSTQHLYTSLVNAMYGPGAVRTVVIETPSGSKSVRAAKAMASAYSIVACVTTSGNRPYVLLSAQTVKKRLCNVKTASKAEVADAVCREMLDIDKLPKEAKVAKIPYGKLEHLYDAAALCLAAWDEPVVMMLRGGAGR